MNKKFNIFAVVLLLANLVMQPIVSISTAFAQEEGAAVESSSAVTDPVPAEPIEAPSESAEIPPAEPPAEDTTPESPIPVENGDTPNEEEGSTEDEEESSEESEEEEEAVTAISNLGGDATSNIRTGSTVYYGFNVQNTGAELENAIVRVTIDGTHIAPYDAAGQYFPNQGLSQLSFRTEGSNYIIEYSASDLSAEYNKNFTFAFKTLDNGTIKNGTTIPVKAEVIQNGSVVKQTGNVNYSFVTRQPQFTSNVIYPSESASSDDDSEGAQKQTEVSYSFSFGEEGTGDGSGQSEVTNLEVRTTVPETLTFDASLNEGWSFDETSRVASLSVKPEASIYSSSYKLPNTLRLVANESGEAVEEQIFAEAYFTFTNGDTAHKTNQAEVSLMSTMVVMPLAAIDTNLLTSFKFILNPGGPNEIVVENGEEYEVNVDEMNAANLVYGFTKPDDYEITAGDTYAITLHELFTGVAVSDRPIIIEGDTVATYSIVGNQVIITFTDLVNEYDDVEMFVDLSAEFNVNIFEEQEEVVVNVPYADGTSFEVTIIAEQEEYAGTDKKEAGSPYILKGNEKVTVNRNPEFVDWTVRANDSMGTFESATIIDDLGPNLEIVEGSFTVEKIIRNRNNEEIGREPVEATPTITDTGFELNLGAIEDAYDITYTTRLIRPEGGGTLTVNNTARIILDGNTNSVPKGVEVTWSGDIPTIDKSVKAFDANNANVIKWQVEYNYGLENIASDVILTDTLTHGDVILDTVRVMEVETDIDGNVTSEVGPSTVTPTINADGNMVIPNLDANGKAYLITFQSTVPVGLVDETIVNTISDNYENTDNAEVNVNTVPTGGKIGEQLVDDEGQPYIKWTITMNSQKVDISSINIKDVFNGDYLTFDVADTKLFEDGGEVDNYSVAPYTHDDGRIGFDLSVTDAGPHLYTFEYLTYYTTLGMQQPTIANDAELIFDQGSGIGIGVDIGFDQTGPKAGIGKNGKYVLNEATGLQEIEWTIYFNNSRILLEKPLITDTFTSGNYTYIDGSLKMTENDVTFSDFDFKETSDGFTLAIDKDTNARYVITYRTTADDAGNKMQRNDVNLTWQGGIEYSAWEIGKRGPGINKSGDVVINEDGSKTVNWTINFNNNRNVIYDFVLTDTNLPSTVTISEIKVISDGSDVTGEFTVSEPAGGVFTVSKERLDAKRYQLTYSTTLSADEEAQDVKNTAVAVYRGGDQTANSTVPKPTLGVQKDAVSIDKTGESDLINWMITANTDAAKDLVNLTGAVLTDTIPSDQKLVPSSIIATQVSTGTVVESSSITSSDNEFSINLPNGAYQYVVTFQTEILEYPSVNNKIDRYTNSTTLTNTNYKPVSDEAYIDYFADGTNNNSTKEGSQNEDTENIDWNLTLNPLGLTINNALITDQLSDNQTYVADSIKITDETGTPIDGAHVVVSEDNRSFDITFNKALEQLVTITYSTRLNEELVGNYNVSNNVKILGGTERRELHTVTKSTRASQWSFGGGGSGRVLDMNFTKLDADNDEPLEGVSFSLSTIRGSSETHVANFDTLDDGTAVLLKQRAGRYILTEISTLPDYVQQSWTFQ